MASPWLLTPEHGTPEHALRPTKASVGPLTATLPEAYARLGEQLERAAGLTPAADLPTPAASTSPPDLAPHTATTDALIPGPGPSDDHARHPTHAVNPSAAPVHASIPGPRRPHPPRGP